MERSLEVSVVLPAYNEAETLQGTVEKTVETLSSFLPPGAFEVLIAEDGCTDRTPEIAAHVASEDTRVRHIHYDERLGRGGALTRAFRAANGDTLAYIDTDLATDMGHLETLVESVRSDEYDVATGSRLLTGSEARRPAKRDVPSRVYNTLVRLFLRSSLHDHQCGFKAFDQDVLETLLSSVEDDHWFWDTEVLVRAQRAGYRVREFPVVWMSQEETKVDMVHDITEMGSQILRMWWHLAVVPRITRRIPLDIGSPPRGSDRR